MTKSELDEILKGRVPKDIDELNQILREEMARRNNTPRAEFCGITSMEMYSLVHDPFGEESVFGFRDFDPAVLDACPFFRLVEEILRLTVLEKNPYPLTASTASLPVKVVKTLYETGYCRETYIDSGIVKLAKERDWAPVHTGKIMLELAGIVRKQHGKWHLTKKGEKLVRDRVGLFREVFQVFTLKFNWAYHDGYTHPTAGQLAFGFSLSLLAHFGDQDREAHFYAEKYLSAFPMLLQETPSESWFTPKQQLTRCFISRFFYRFAFWFGLAEKVSEGGFLNTEHTVLRKGRLLEELFRVAYHRNST